MGEYDKLLLDKNAASYKRRLTVKLIALFVFLALSAFGIYKLYPYAGMLRSSEGRDYLKAVVDDNIVKGASLFVSLQALQVILGVIPPLQIVGGVLFGFFWGTVFSVIGIFLGSTVVFVLVKIIGYPLVQTMFSEEKLNKFKFLHDENKVMAVLSLMYIFPGFPKDLLTYFVPLTKVSKKDFFFVLMPLRIPAIVMSGVVGGSIRSENYTAAVFFAVIVIIASILGIIFRNRILSYFHKHKNNKIYP